MELLWVCLDFGGVLNDDRGARNAMVALVAELVGVGVEEAWGVRRRLGSILATLEHYSTPGGGFAELRGRFEERILEIPEAFGPPPFGDVTGALERLSRRYRLALVSNTVGTARPWLERYGLTKRFDHLHLSNEIGFRKPQPEFFRGLIESVSAEPGEMIMVGDRCDTDLAPALDAGMAAVLISRFERQQPGYEEIKGRLFAEVADLGKLADRLGC